MEFREIQLIDLTRKKPPEKPIEVKQTLREGLALTAGKLLSIQHPDGYWWFTLQANESIGAEFIFLMHFLEEVDKEIQGGLCRRLLNMQRPDGSWALYEGGPADLSTIIECYFALKLGGYNTNLPQMKSAREVILKLGGIVKSRVFTKIHLAMFGLVPWSACPEMPAELILLPKWFPINIYEFSSWARASIVPLLIFMSVKPVKKLEIDLEELFCEPEAERDYTFATKKGPISLANAFLYIDKFLKFFDKIPFKPLRKLAITRCSRWTSEHVERTADIYPALAYAALAHKAIGLSNEDPKIRIPFKALRSFQERSETIHQQCCISPVWDTPWTAMALLEAGIPNNSAPLLRAGRWLISQQITDFKGDWAVKNPKGEAGGWAFEFKNDYFPDIDDTIEVISVLNRLALPQDEKEVSIRKGISWLLSMQNKDGGWGAFDKNQTLTLVNEIPFADHGACLDPSTPDITGRMIELFAIQGMTPNDKPMERALEFIYKTQEPFGGWFGRWGINYLYGTWCVLTGLSELGWNANGFVIKKAVSWLKGVQFPDGGYGESPESYNRKTFVKWKESVPSQTAWALMGLVAAGEAKSKEAQRAANFLMERINPSGSWDEDAYTGTGFPGHFYIRYHGYRSYFPLLALARYNKAISS